MGPGNSALDQDTSAPNGGSPLSALRAKPPRDTTSHVPAVMDLRDSGCYASNETLQHTVVENASRAVVDPGAVVVEASKGGDGSLGHTQNSNNSSQKDSSQSKDSETGDDQSSVTTLTEDSKSTHTIECSSQGIPVGTDTPTTKAQSNVKQGQELEQNDSGVIITPSQPESSQRRYTPCVSPLLLPHSVPEENGDGTISGADDATSGRRENDNVFSRESTPSNSPRTRVRPRPPIRRAAGAATSSATTTTFPAEESDSTTSELSPLRRLRPGGVAHRLSSQSSQTSSPCGSPPPPGSNLSPLGSPLQMRSQSLPGSPLRSHSPSMLVHLPPRPHSPVFHHRSPSSHRYSTPNIQATFKSRLRPSVPERTSSLPRNIIFGSTDSINSGTQTNPQVIYAENGIQPSTFGSRSQNGHVHLRRSSTPALRTYLSYTPPGSPQKGSSGGSRLPTFSTGSAGSLSSRIGGRHDSLLSSRRRQKAVSVTLEALVVAKLEEEGIDLTLPPYTDSVSSIEYFRV